LPQQIVAIYHLKFPDGLICSTCGRLLASSRASYASPRLEIGAALGSVASKYPSFLSRWKGFYRSLDFDQAFYQTPDTTQFVCAECSEEALELARVKEIKSASLVLARAARGRQEPAEAQERGSIRVPTETDQNDVRPIQNPLITQADPGRKISPPRDETPTPRSGPRSEQSAARQQRRRALKDRQREEALVSKMKQREYARDYRARQKKSLVTVTA
jgi:hypothetical protein